MEFFIEPERKTPFHSSVDVIVVGAGPAGISAAINSARLGAKTLLIEQMGSVGGDFNCGVNEPLDG